MAKHANSTPVPIAHLQPPNPLPTKASQAWQDLWQSVMFTHPRAAETLMQAHAAGVEPTELVFIQLCAPKDQHWPMPRFGFGGTYVSPARVFGPNGEVAQ